MKAPLRIFGVLEAEIMPVVWDRGCVTVKEIHEEIGARRAIAYTTIMTTMDRLVGKGLLCRERHGPIYVYTPLMSRQEYARLAVLQIIDELLDGDIISLAEVLSAC